MNAAPDSLEGIDPARAGKDVLPYLPPSAIDLDGRRIVGEGELAAWLKAHGLAPQLPVVLVGSPVDRALDWAEGAHAPFVVAGSRHLSTAERIVQASTGTSLAATARTPVLVVPAAA